MKLQVETLSWKIQEYAIVNGIDLFVDKGEFVGVIGPNGSGKSSLLRCIYRVNKPVHGVIFLDGNDVWKLQAREVAQRSASVLQEMPNQFDFTVREIVAMGRYPHKKFLEKDNERDQRLVIQALKYVGMLPYAERMFFSLSGGEKQRTLVARAIAQEAGFLILDEPTNHLDIYYQLEIMDLIKNIGVASLVVMHDLNLAAQYCDRLYVMKKGQIFASGSPKDVLTQEIIRDVYNVESSVSIQPETGRPQVLFSRKT